MATSRKSDLKVFNIQDPVYKFNVGILYGKQKAAFELFEKLSGGKLPKIFGKTYACFLQSPESDLYAIWLPRGVEHATIGHEVIHLIFNLFQVMGIPITVENQETFAYHWQWWYQAIKDKIKKAR